MTFIHVTEYIQVKSSVDQGFNDLFKDDPDVKKAHLCENQSDADDEDIIVGDYNSDEETMQNDNSDDDEEEEHITKVNYSFVCLMSVLKWHAFFVSFICISSKKLNLGNRCLG